MSSTSTETSPSSPSRGPSPNPPTEPLTLPFELIRIIAQSSASQGNYKTLLRMSMGSKLFRGEFEGWLEGERRRFEDPERWEKRLSDLTGAQRCLVRCARSIVFEVTSKPPTPLLLVYSARSQLSFFPEYPNLHSVTISSIRIADLVATSSDICHPGVKHVRVVLGRDHWKAFSRHREAVLDKLRESFPGMQKLDMEWSIGNLLQADLPYDLNPGLLEVVTDITSWLILPIDVDMDVALNFSRARSAGGIQLESDLLEEKQKYEPGESHIRSVFRVGQHFRSVSARFVNVGDHGDAVTKLLYAIPACTGNKLSLSDFHAFVCTSWTPGRYTTHPLIQSRYIMDEFASDQTCKSSMYEGMQLACAILQDHKRALLTVLAHVMPGSSDTEPPASFEVISDGMASVDGGEYQLFQRMSARLTATDVDTVAPLDESEVPADWCPPEVTRKNYPGWRTRVPAGTKIVMEPCKVVVWSGNEILDVVMQSSQGRARTASGRGSSAVDDA